MAVADTLPFNSSAGFVMSLKPLGKKFLWESFCIPVLGLKGDRVRSECPWVPGQMSPVTFHPSWAFMLPDIITPGALVSQPRLLPRSLWLRCKQWWFSVNKEAGNDSSSLYQSFTSHCAPCSHLPPQVWPFFPHTHQIKLPVGLSQCFFFFFLTVFT